MRILLTIAAVLFSFQFFAQTCVGVWDTYDDKTGKKKSKVELYKKDGKLWGKITYLYPREGRGPNPKCTKCTGNLKDKPLDGLRLLGNLTWNGEEWEGGYIVDPETGKSYTLKLWIDEGEPDVLNVRGYIGFFYRTQTWKRVK